MDNRFEVVLVRGFTRRTIKQFDSLVDALLYKRKRQRQDLLDGRFIAQAEDIEAGTSDIAYIGDWFNEVNDDARYEVRPLTS